MEKGAVGPDEVGVRGRRQRAAPQAALKDRGTRSIEEAEEGHREVGPREGRISEPRG